MMTNLLRRAQGIWWSDPIVSTRRAFSSVVVLKEGDVLCKEREFTEADVLNYSELSHDANPIHIDTLSAQSAGLQRPVVHGILYAGLFPSIIASHFPGAIYASQTLKFKLPVYIGENVLAEVHTLEIRRFKQKYRVKFATKCFKKEGMFLALDGEAVALLPSLCYSK